MSVLIVKNASGEGPGLLEEVLAKHAIACDLADLCAGDHFPEPKNYSAVFVFGGPDSANDDTPKMEEEIGRIREILGAKIPYLGICLGMQALVKAAGGKVCRNNIKEVGWRDPEGNYFEIELTEEGRKDPLFRGLRSPLRIFQLHGETVDLVPGIALLATGKHCRNQAVRVGANAYGLQGHLELTREMFEDWIATDPDLLKLDADSLRDDYMGIRSAYESNGRQILENFLGIAKAVN